MIRAGRPPRARPPVCAGADSDGVSATPSSPLPSVSVLELAALHAGKPKTHGHNAVHPVLERAAKVVEELLPPDQQHRLPPLAARLAHTQAAAASEDGHRLCVRLVCWATRHVLHLTADRAFAESVLFAAEFWCDDGAGSAAAHRLLNAPAVEHLGLTRADHAVRWVQRAAVGPTRSVYSPAQVVELVLELIHNDHANKPDEDIADLLMAFLAALLDEYDRLTGRQPVDLLTPSEVATLNMLAALTC